MRLTCILLMTLPLACIAQQSVNTQPTMQALYVQDQRDRGVPLAENGIDLLPKADADKLPSLSWDQINKRDADRRATVRRMLADGKVDSGEDFYDAAFIFQHGQEPDDYLLAHILAVEAVVKGFPRAAWISAATLDRYLQAIGQKQVFGTQFPDVKFAYILRHRTDKDLAEKLKSLPNEATQEPYSETLLPDALRKNFCVPPLAVQQQYVSDKKNGKKSDIPRLPDCSR